MTEAFTKELIEAGITQMAVDILVAEEFIRSDQLKTLTFDNFIAMGIKGRSASILAEKFGTSQIAANPGTVTFPEKIQLVTEKTPEQMTAAELLTYLAANPNDLDALASIRIKEPIASAAAKTEQWAIRQDNALAVGKTLEYCRYLRKPGAKPQRMYQNVRPTTIERALGVVEKALIHPIAEGEVIQDGLDQWGNDWSSVPIDLMKAIYWARKNGHRFWPANPDPLTIYDEIITSELPRRWQSILADYQDLVESEDPTALISLVWKASNDAGAKTERPDVRFSTEHFASAEQFVRGRSQGNLSSDSHNNTVSGVYDSVYIVGHNVRFEGAIALGSVSVDAYNCKGTLLTAPGVSVKISAHSNDLRQVVRSWEELEKMVK